MPVPFGFSIGDFIAGVSFLIDVYDAVQSTGGAASDYRQQSQWLEQLISVLQSLESAQRDDTSVLASQCAGPLQEFHDKIRRKYDKQLKGKSGSTAGVVYKSLQWTFLKSASKDLIKLKNAIGPQLQAIGLKIGKETKDATVRIEEWNRIAYDDTTSRLNNIRAEVTQVNQVSVETLQVAQSIREETRVVGDAVQGLLHSQPTAITDACYGQLATLMRQAVKEALQDQALQWQSANLASKTSAKTSTIQFPTQSVTDLPPPYDAEAGTTVIASEHKSTQQQYIHADRYYRAEKHNLVPLTPQRSVKRRSLGFGSLKIEIIKVQIGTRLEARVDLTFQPARWTFNKGAIVSLQQVSRLVSGRSITIKPNTFNIVPMDSEIFIACRDLDIGKVQELFETHKASPFDRDEFGGSLIDWTLNSFLESPGRGAPENFKLQELVHLTRLLLDSGLRFEPQPSHPVIQATALQVFLSSGHLLDNREEYGRTNKSSQAWDEVAAYVFYSLSMDTFTNTIFHLNLSQFLNSNLEVEGNYVYFEHNLPFICWDGALHDELQGRLYKLHPRRALTALMLAEDFVEACAPRSMSHIDEHLRFLQTAIRDKNPAASIWVDALSKLLRKGRRLSVPEIQELTFCAERYGMSKHWRTAVELAGYSEDALNIPYLSHMWHHRSIPGAFVEDSVDDSEDDWEDIKWTGRHIEDSVDGDINYTGSENGAASKRRKNWIWVRETTQTLPWSVVKVEASQAKEKLCDGKGDNISSLTPKMPEQLTWKNCFTPRRFHVYSKGILGYVQKVRFTVQACQRKSKQPPTQEHPCASCPSG